MVRRLEFLRPMIVSLLTQRRGPYAPYGVAGGQSGALGVNLLIRASGEQRTLENQVRLSVEAGDQLVVQTPGGGGFGSP